MPTTSGTRLASVAATIPLAALTLTGLAGATPAAAAACSSTTITSTDIRDSEIVVGTRNTRSVDLLAVVEDSCRVARVDISIRSSQGGQSFRAEKVDTDGDQTSWLVSVDLSAPGLLNEEAGGWTSSVTAKGSTTTSKAGPAFRVLRNSRVSLDARPEPVRKGQKITFTGAVERANWETEKYVGYPDRTVDLQWRATGATTYSSVKRIKAGAKGVLATSVVATRDGCYRIVFAGSPVTGRSTSTPDCVDVR